jgi:peroxiredoxin Q/BCP
MQKFDVAYFMASVDPLEKNIAFAKEHNAGFPILSDPDKKLMTTLGNLHQMGFANRWTYYIDKDGKILKIDRDVKVATAGADMARIMGELGFPQK